MGPSQDEQSLVGLNATTTPDQESTREPIAPATPVIDTRTETAGVALEKTEKKKKRLIALILFLLFLLCALGLFLWVIFSSGDPKALVGSLDPNAQEKVVPLPNDRPESVDIPGYPSVIPIQAGSEKAYIDLHNPETNAAYLSFELVLGDIEDGQFVEKEVLYTSDLVQPGYSITMQELTRALDAGTYDAAINIQAYMFDPETKETFELNGVQNTVQFEVIEKD